MRIVRGKPAYGESKQALIKAAVRLVARDGISKLTYRSLAAEADVSSGAVQHNFNSIDDVLDCAFEYCLDQAYAYGNHVESLTDFVNAIETLNENEPELQIFQTEIFLAARNSPTLMDIAERHQEVYRQITRDMLANLQISHDENLVEFITAAVDGIVFESVVFGKDQLPRTRKQFEVLKYMILNYPSASQPALQEHASD